MAKPKSPTKSPPRGVAVDPSLRGKGPKKGAPNAGRPTDEFKAEMRRLAASPGALKRLKQLLTEDSEADTFLKALAFAADRGYGKAAQSVDVTTGGEPLQSFTLGIATA